MAEIICILGNKGGTGKTTLSHMLSQGLGLLGYKSACVLTDTAREPLSPEGRRYITADARTPAALDRVIEKLGTLEGWLGVIDGGGNRPEIDHILYDLGGIVILPFRESHEDMRTVMQDLDSFPRAYALPSQWPTNPWQREAADRHVGQMLSDYTDRLLRPIPALSSTKLLLHKKLPAPVPTALSNACRAFARQVLDVLELTYAQEAEAYYGGQVPEDEPDAMPDSNDTTASATQETYAVGAHYLRSQTEADTDDPSADSTHTQTETDDAPDTRSEALTEEDAAQQAQEAYAAKADVLSDEAEDSLDEDSATPDEDEAPASEADEIDEPLEEAPEQARLPETPDTAYPDETTAEEAAFSAESQAHLPVADTADEDGLGALEEDPFPATAPSYHAEVTEEAAALAHHEEREGVSDREGEEPSSSAHEREADPSHDAQPPLGTRETPFGRRSTETGEGWAEQAEAPPPARPQGGLPS